MADLADLNVKRCLREHDCHNTPGMLYAGQNLNFYARTDKFVDIPTFMEETLPSWYSEKEFATQANIDAAFGDDSGPKQVFHFLQLVADRANQVGCAIAQWTDAQGKKDTIACNYSFAVISDYRVYESGAPGSKCETGTNPNYPALCSENESIDPNNISSLISGR